MSYLHIVIHCMYWLSWESHYEKKSHLSKTWHNQLQHYLYVCAGNKYFTVIYMQQDILYQLHVATGDHSVVLRLQEKLYSYNLVFE